MNVLVVGGGAAGFFAAIRAADTHPEAAVTLVEKGTALLSKVKISGGGRCNVTHACFEPHPLAGFYPRGGKALIGPFHRFQPKDTMAWFEARGVRLKIEADNRVFPVTDSSQTIIDCLMKAAAGAGVRIRTRCGVDDITSSPETNRFSVRFSDGSTGEYDAVILATGSSRQGYALAERLGHTIEPPVPSLFTFTVKDEGLRALSGLSVNPVRLQAAGEKSLVQEGALLMTHWGLSGPAAIKLSAWGARYFFERQYQAELRVNWVYGMSREDVGGALRAFQQAHPKKRVAGQSPFAVLPHRLWEYLTVRAGVSGASVWQELSGKRLDALTDFLMAQPVQMDGKGTFKEEFVTCGGVRLDEVNFKTMESKHCPGLYFAGEILDVDGVTGGFNFQNAWTTGWIAGEI